MEIMDQAAMERVAKLQLIARTVVESFVSGQHRSVYKGFSAHMKCHALQGREALLHHRKKM